MSELALITTQPRVIGVAELNRLVRELLEQHLPLMWVGGELSNFRRYDSGHCYFTLKDADAQVDCVMFRMKAQLLGWRPENGMQVEVRACPTLYESRGKFQLNVEAMRRAGLGALYEAFERLKAKLEGEGLFDPARKRALPRFPARLGIVTSPQAAALRDVLTTLKRRMPSLQVIVYPTPVQGEGAAARIARAISTAGARGECDVLILCRGGGSIEDLWAYNEETLARAIAACPIPLVSGVGHETDFTIADFVADVRAPTPTAAAELVSCDRLELCGELRHLTARLRRIVQRGLENRMQRLDYLSRCLVHPGDRIRSQRQHLAHLANRLCSGWKRASEARSWRLLGAVRDLEAAKPELPALDRACAELGRRLAESTRVRLAQEGARLEALGAHLKHLNPDLVLERGYSIATDASGTIVHDAAQLKAGDPVRLRFGRGAATAEVKSTTSER
ncbi:MAG: exodeoxyribonuclease VII large subunit [Burkholderiales bacterium]